MINELKRLVSHVLFEAEQTEEDLQAQITKFLDAKRSGKAVGSGDVAADLRRQLTKMRNMWLVPFASMKRSRKHYPGTFGQIIGSGDDKRHFEFHPKTAWVMTKPGHAVPFVEAVDKMQHQKKELPAQFPVVVPFGVANHNPSLDAAVKAGIAKAVTLDTEARTMKLGHDESIWALSGSGEEAVAARKAATDAMLSASRSALSSKGDADEEARRAEIERLMKDQDSDDIGSEWSELSDEFYGSNDAVDDEYDPAGEFGTEFEDEFKRRSGLR